MTTEQMAKGGMYATPKGSWVVFMEYVTKAQRAIAEADPDNPGELGEYLTRHCTECDRNIYGPDGKHIMYTGPGAAGIPFVLVGCEGYWLIKPGLLDLDPKIALPENVASWTDWTTDRETS